MSFSEYIETVLKEKGYRFTNPRKVVADVLGENKVALNAYEIEKKLISKGEKVDIVTIYRIIEVFVSLGLVHEVRGGYLACTHVDCHEKNHCHHQFICERCSEVTELHLDECFWGGNLSQKFPGIEVKSHYLELTGNCNSCAVKN